MSTQSLSSGLKVSATAESASRGLAAHIAKRIREHAEQSKHYVLGLATGSSPLPLYRELVRLHHEEGLGFKNVVTFNLDEYFSLPATSPQSYHHFMQEHLFKHLNIPSEQTHIPDGTIGEGELSDYCRDYESLITEVGGIDLQILGIGRSGHIGFNEPPSQSDSRTRLVQLADMTREDAASDFGGIEQVPQKAITMGIGTILEAREISLLAWGEHKAAVIKETFESEPSPDLPASFLKHHPQVTCWLDSEAAAQLPTF